MSPYVKVMSFEAKEVAALFMTIFALDDDERYISSSLNSIFAVYFPGSRLIGSVA